ncbi:MAG TPA: UPF0158 family protein [Symbiobacteriaceae bacterium]|nr:UPF0158 family protein [Symbiobacteriaceae bacterium]
MAKKKVAVDLDALEMALTDGGGEIMWYLDTKTGEVILSDELDDEEAFEDEDLDLSDVELAEAAEEEELDRYILIDPFPSRIEYQDMADFADTVSDKHLRDKLDVALDGKGAFRRFKNVLLDYPDVREQWFQFRDKRMHKRVLEWLQENGLELENR